MTFTLPANVLAWRERIRRFVDDELIPWDVHAELNAGENTGRRHGAATEWPST